MKLSKKPNDYWICIIGKNIRYFEVVKRDEKTFFETEAELPMYKQVHTDSFHIYKI